MLAVFKSEVQLLLVSFFKLIRRPQQAENWYGRMRCRLLAGIVLGTIPAVAVALVLKDRIEQLFSSSLFVV